MCVCAHACARKKILEHPAETPSDLSIWLGDAGLRSEASSSPGQRNLLGNLLAIFIEHLLCTMPELGIKDTVISWVLPFPGSLSRRRESNI